MSGRPTHAQVCAVSDLRALIARAEAAIVVAVSIADLDMLHEVVSSSRALIARIERDESWVSAAIAGLTAWSPLVARATARGAAR